MNRRNFTKAIVGVLAAPVTPDTPGISGLGFREFPGTEVAHKMLPTLEILTTAGNGMFLRLDGEWAPLPIEWTPPAIHHSTLPDRSPWDTVVLDPTPDTPPTGAEDCPE